MCNFNKEQQLAIDTIDKNVCVIAGAGTGKTQILTHRFINIIKSDTSDPIETMNSILAITFTKKATGEMIERIEKEILKLGEDDNRYKNLINYIPFLNVSTIDSFCKSIIDENSLAIGLPSDYEIIDEAEGSRILKGVINQVLEKHMKDKVLKDYMIVNNFFRFSDLANSLGKAYRKINQKGYDYDNLLSLFPGTGFNKENHLKFISKLENDCLYLIENKFATGKSNFVKEIKAGLFEDLRTNEDEEFISGKLSLIKKGVLNVSKAPEENKESIKKLVNSELIKYECNYFNYYELINTLLKEIEHNFRSEKLQKGKLEFDDLIYYTAEIFKDREVLKFYQEKFKYIMIDEYQDTNSNQRKIFYSLSSGKKLLDRNNFFVVGDPKQSIYGFRGSDMNVFKETIEDIKNSDGLVIELVENYRSSQELVGFSNLLFEKIMGDNYGPLNWNTAVENKKVRYIDLINEEISEAEAIAREILRLTDEGTKHEDIAILFRSSPKLKVLEDALNKYKIPYINPKSKEFYNKREIKDLVLFLNFLNAHEDSKSLYGLLRSSIFMIEDYKLYELNLSHEKYLYKKLFSYSGSDSKIIYARDILGDIISRKGQSNVYELLSEFIELTKYYEILSLISNTTQEIENVRKFEELALEFVNNEAFTVNEFLDYLASVSLVDSGEAQVEGHSNAINLMTIHGSKGLEYPVIIFYDSVNRHRYSGELIEVNGTEGYGLKIGEDSIIYESVKNTNSQEDKEERDRLLYVCVTRAKEEFIFINKPSDNKGNIPNNSFLYDLVSLEDYEYHKITELPLLENPKDEKLVIVSNESLVDEKDKYDFERKSITSSITRYNCFSRCPREYYLRYKLGIQEINLREEKLEEDSKNENYLGMDYARYGSLVHNIIENYNSEIELEDQVENALKSIEVNTRGKIKNFLLKHVENYSKRKYNGKKVHEFEFLYKLEEGKMSGSIDLVILDKENIQIVDFKTNRIRNLNKLIEDYTPQLRLYAMAIKEIFGRPTSSSSIHFLDIDEIAEINWDEEENKKLINQLNSFLRFVTVSDSIDEYECRENCHEYCDFLDFCNKEKNEK